MPPKKSSNAQPKPKSNASPSKHLSKHQSMTARSVMAPAVTPAMAQVLAQAQTQTQARAQAQTQARVQAGLQARVQGPVQSRRLGRDPNYQCRVDIYDELRAKCAKDTANCRAVASDGSPLSYTDCERQGATAADLLNKFPTDKESNQRLKALLKEGRDSGDPTKKDWDLSAAKRCLTQMWYGTEDGRARLDACPPPKRSSRVKPKSRFVQVRGQSAKAKSLQGFL